MTQLSKVHLILLLYVASAEFVLAFVPREVIQKKLYVHYMSNGTKVPEKDNCEMTIIEAPNGSYKLYISSSVQPGTKSNRPMSGTSIFNIQRNTQHYTSTASTLKFTLGNNDGWFNSVIPFTTNDDVYVISIVYGSQPLQYTIAFYTLGKNNKVDKQLVLGTEIVSPASAVSITFTAQRSTTQVALRLK